MKELIPAIWDDLVLKETGEKVAAQETVHVGLEGRWAELDVQSETAREIRRLIGTYMAAGRRVTEVPETAKMDPSGFTQIQFNRKMREWADEQGRSAEYRTNTDGVYKYRPQLIADFREWLCGKE
jgi:Lsr2